MRVWTAFAVLVAVGGATAFIHLGATRRQSYQPPDSPQSYENASQSAEVRLDRYEVKHLDTGEQQPARKLIHDPQPIVQYQKAKHSSPVGRVKLRTIDSDTFLPLPCVRVRAASKTRFADCDTEFGTNSIELKLTPDSYDLLVLCDGYEPLQLTCVEVEGGGTVTVDPLLMSAGSCVLAGTVTGLPASEKPMWVELTGHGRRPCRDCPTDKEDYGLGYSELVRAWLHYEPCPHCGYGVQTSKKRLERGSFEFGNLASGRYAVRLIDEHDLTLGAQKLVELREAESLNLALEYVAPRRVSVEILDTDGRTLATEWARRARIAAASLVDQTFLVDSENEGLPWFDCAFRFGETTPVDTWFLAPPFDPSSPGGRVLSVPTNCHFHFSHPLDDRPRSEHEDLEPEHPTPGFWPSEVPCGVDTEGFVWFESIPSLDLTLELKCAGFSSTVAVPAAPGGGRLRARLARDKPGESAGTISLAQTYLEYELTRSR